MDSKAELKKELALLETCPEDSLPSKQAKYVAAANNQWSQSTSFQLSQLTPNIQAAQSSTFHTSSQLFQSILQPPTTVQQSLLHSYSIPTKHLSKSDHTTVTLPSSRNGRPIQSGKETSCAHITETLSKQVQQQQQPVESQKVPMDQAIVQLNQQISQLYKQMPHAQQQHLIKMLADFVKAQGTTNSANAGLKTQWSNSRSAAQLVESIATDQLSQSTLSTHAKESPASINLTLQPPQVEVEQLPQLHSNIGLTECSSRDNTNQSQSQEFAEEKTLWKRPRGKRGGNPQKREFYKLRHSLYNQTINHIAQLQANLVTSAMKEIDERNRSENNQRNHKFPFNNNRFQNTRFERESNSWNRFNRMKQNENEFERSKKNEK